MRRQSWTIERLELLRKMWAEGETAAAIGARLGGLSRSAVLGKVFRLRLRAGEAAVAAERQQKNAANDRPGRAEAPARRRRGGGRNKHSPSAPSAGRRRKTLLELTNNSCRWPYGRPGSGKFFFCGAPEADLACGIPYCPRHMRRAYSKGIIFGESGAARADRRLLPSDIAP